MPKRKRTEDNINFKLMKKHNNLWKQFNNYKSEKNDVWISATSIKNSLLNNCLSDWLDLYHPSASTQKNNRLCEMLFSKGNEYEKYIFNQITNSVGKKNCITICPNSVIISPGETKYYENTKNAIYSGIPLIFQGYLRNEDSKTYGIADIIIRSDFIKKLVPNFIDPYEDIGDGLGNSYHYRIIDVKWTTLLLCSNGSNILNAHRFPSYKGQLAIYNVALGQIQCYTCPQAYIIGTGWKNNAKNSHNLCWSDKLGVIDYSAFDRQFIKKTVDGIKWMHNLHKNGHKWSIDPPSIVELYPNLTQIDRWITLKNDLANKNFDLTKLWYIGHKQRLAGLQNGIKKYTDKKCSSLLLNVTGKRGDIINKIIKVNKSKTPAILPKKIKNNTDNWKKKISTEYYIDFESIHNIFYYDSFQLPQIAKEPYKTGDTIFMIGVGFAYHPIDIILDQTYKYLHNNKKYALGDWCYMCFSMEIYDPCLEIDLVGRMRLFVSERSKLINPKQQIKIFHWGNAEQYLYKKALISTDISIDEYTWINLYNIFIDEPIVIKGACNFKLKSIGKALYSLNLITTKISETITDGLDAMLDAIEYYKNKDKYKDTFTDIVKYNEIDCKLLWEILTCIRCSSNK